MGVGCRLRLAPRCRLTPTSHQVARSGVRRPVAPGFSAPAGSGLRREAGAVAGRIGASLAPRSRLALRR